MRNEPWVWPEVGDAGTSGAGAVPLRSAQMMGQQQQQQQQKDVKKGEGGGGMALEIVTEGKNDKIEKNY